MADAECVFLLALASARRRSYLLALSIASDSWVFDRGNTQQQLVVSLLSEPGFLAKNQLPTQAPEWITLPGGWGGSQRMFIHWNCSFRDHEEPRKPMDRGDCQGSLHSSWSLVRPCDSAWGPSAFSFMGVQLSGGSTWNPVSGVLEVFRGVPEFGSAWHGLCCWGHVDTGSSGGCTTRSGSRTSSPTSIAYTICMQPLLRRS